MVEGDSDVVLAADNGVPCQGLRCTGVQLECHTLARRGEDRGWREREEKGEKGKIGEGERERDIIYMYVYIGVRKRIGEGERKRRCGKRQTRRCKRVRLKVTSSFSLLS